MPQLSGCGARVGLACILGFTLWPDGRGKGGVGRRLRASAISRQPEGAAPTSGWPGGWFRDGFPAANIALAQVLLLLKSDQLAPER